MLAPCALAAEGAPEWRYIENWQEPLDGYATNAASAEAPGGAEIFLYRSPAGRVMALYRWPEGLGALPATGAVATLTPEGFASKTIEAQDTPGRIVEYARVSGDMLRDRLWHGEGRTPVGTLADMLAAPSVQIELRFEAGTERFTWPMAEAGLPVARALGLTLEGVPAGAEWEDAAAGAMLAAMTACQFPKLDVDCVQKVSACAPQISEARDIPGFEACVAPDMAAE